MKETLTSFWKRKCFTYVKWSIIKENFFWFCFVVLCFQSNVTNMPRSRIEATCDSLGNVWCRVSINLMAKSTGLSLNWQRPTRDSISGKQEQHFGFCLGRVWLVKSTELAWAGERQEASFKRKQKGRRRRRVALVKQVRRAHGYKNGLPITSEVKIATAFARFDRKYFGGKLSPFERVNVEWYNHSKNSGNRYTFATTTPSNDRGGEILIRLNRRTLARRNPWFRPQSIGVWNDSCISDVPRSRGSRR